MAVCVPLVLDLGAGLRNCDAEVHAAADTPRRSHHEHRSVFYCCDAQSVIFVQFTGSRAFVAGVEGGCNPVGFSRGQRDPLFTCGEGDSLDSIISTQDNSEDDRKDARYSAGEDTGDIKHQRIAGYAMET